MPAEHQQADGERRRQQQPDRPPQRAPEQRRQDQSQRRDAGRTAEQQGLDELADHDVAGDDKAQHQEGLQPARRHGQGDQRRQHGAQDRADIGHEAQRAGQQAPQQRVGHSQREQAGADRDAKPRLVRSCSDSTRATRSRRRPRFRRGVHVAGAEQPHELVAELVAVEQDEDHEDDDDADREQGMQQRRHEGGDLRKWTFLCARTAGAGARRPGGDPGRATRSWR